MNGYIYITVNWISGKKYIGQTNGNEPSYIGSGRIMIKAIKKYGRENFTKEILCSCNNRELLDYWETYYIDKFNAVESKEFYNLNRGRELPKEHIKKITFISSNKRKKKVYELDNEGRVLNTYNSIVELASLINVYPTNIVSTCKANIAGKLRKCRGKFYSYIPSLNFDYKKYSVTKKVIASDGKYKKIFDSINQAAEEFNINPNTIRDRILKGGITKKVPYILSYAEKN